LFFPLRFAQFIQRLLELEAKGVISTTAQKQQQTPVTPSNSKPATGDVISVSVATDDISTSSVSSTPSNDSSLASSPSASSSPLAAASSSQQTPVVVNNSKLLRWRWHYHVFLSF
jgi:hypothetical protein